MGPLVWCYLQSRLGCALLRIRVYRAKANRFAAAKRGLAVALAVGLLLVDVLAANVGFHQSLHHNGVATSNTCVFCLFAKGQVDLPQAAPVVVTSVPTALAPTPIIHSIVPVDVTYLVFSSRAPPALPFFVSIA